MKQTAVECLAKELYEKFEMRGDGSLFDEILEKAKEMERQQQDEQWDDGFDHGYCSRDHDDNDEFLDN